MTTVITRYFEDAGQAHAVKDELVYRQRVPRSIIRIVAQADGLDGLIDGGRILPDTGAAYKERMANGGAVLVVAAGYKPLGVAKIARNAMESMGAVDMGDLSQEVKTKDEGKGLSIIQGQTLMMTRQIDSAAMRYHMADWPIPLISRRKPFARALFDIHARMANFPIPLSSG
ncbi:MAG: PucR family transcriptional regulator, partial [Pseudomonadota bacterium]